MPWVVAGGQGLGGHGAALVRVLQGALANALSAVAAAQAEAEDASATVVATKELIRSSQPRGDEARDAVVARALDEAQAASAARERVQTLLAGARTISSNIARVRVACGVSLEGLWDGSDRVTSVLLTDRAATAADCVRRHGSIVPPCGDDVQSPASLGSDGSGRRGSSPLERVRRESSVDVSDAVVAGAPRQGRRRRSSSCDSAQSPLRRASVQATHIPTQAETGDACGLDAVTASPSSTHVIGGIAMSASSRRVCGSLTATGDKMQNSLTRVRRLSTTEDVICNEAPQSRPSSQSQSQSQSSQSLSPAWRHGEKRKSSLLRQDIMLADSSGVSSSVASTSGSACPPAVACGGRSSPGEGSPLAAARRGSVVRESSPLRRPSQAMQATAGSAVGELSRERIVQRLRRTSLGVMDVDVCNAVDIPPEAIDTSVPYNMSPVSALPRRLSAASPTEASLASGSVTTAAAAVKSAAIHRPSPLRRLSHVATGPVAAAGLPATVGGGAAAASASCTRPSATPATPTTPGTSSMAHMHPSSSDASDAAAHTPSSVILVSPAHPSAFQGFGGAVSDENPSRGSPPVVVAQSLQSGAGAGVGAGVVASTPVQKLRTAPQLGSSPTTSLSARAKRLAEALRFGQQAAAVTGDGAASPGVDSNPAPRQAPAVTSSTCVIC